VKALIVGNRDGTNVGGAIERAAGELNLDARVIESRMAMESPVWVRRANWWLRGRRPTHLGRFSDRIVDECRMWRPDYLLSMGIAPINRPALAAIGAFGIRRLDYLTDDPWNPAHRARWFLNALPMYDAVFSLRRSNLNDLRRAGVRRASYLPFAYCPNLHYPEADATQVAADDVIFAGGCDSDRVPVVASIIKAGFRLALYGILWERFADTREHTRGQADPQTLRKAHGRAKVALCLPRRANRDGHTMRSFELAAMGACVLAEYTDEHREILGEDADTVVYFRSTTEMLEKLRWLVNDADARRRLSTGLFARITANRNTYRDRLEAMIAIATAA